MIGRIYFLFFVTFFSFFSLIFVFLGSLLIFYSDSKSSHEDFTSSKLYQYLEMDHLNDVTLFGTVTMMEEIEDYISFYDTNLEKQILISHIGEEEYECFGSCYCENGGIRRSIGLDNSKNRALVKGISYLCVAVSSLLAVRIASEYFTGKCQEIYSDDECEEEYVQSVVERCRTFHKVDPETIGVEERVYFCYGNCLERMNPRSNHVRPKPSERGIDCSKLKREGVIKVRSDDIVSKPTSKMTLTSKMLSTARVRFQQQYLVKFCRDESKVEYIYNQSVPYTSRVTGERTVKFHEYPSVGYMCTGTIAKRDGNSVSQVKNVRCRQMKPEPKNRNFAYWEEKWWGEKKEWDML